MVFYYMFLQYEHNFQHTLYFGLSKGVVSYEGEIYYVFKIQLRVRNKMLSHMRVVSNK